jgi:hypothetical protein
MGEVWLSQNWPKSKVLEAFTRQSTCELAEFVRERYTERFFEPIRCLQTAPASEQCYGFSIMALCCLLVETLQCYREGLPATTKTEHARLAPLERSLTVPRHCALPASREPGDVFKAFFAACQRKELFPGVDASAFYEDIRCGLLHQAQTKNEWRILVIGPLWDAANKTLNRNEFVEATERHFHYYLSELRSGSWTDEVWQNASRKIWWLAQTS